MQRAQTGKLYRECKEYKGKMQKKCKDFKIFKECKNAKSE